MEERPGPNARRPGYGRRTRLRHRRCGGAAARDRLAAARSAGRCGGDPSWCLRLSPCRSAVGDRNATIADIGLFEAVLPLDKVLDVDRSNWKLAERRPNVLLIDDRVALPGLGGQSATGARRPNVFDECSQGPPPPSGMRLLSADPAPVELARQGGEAATISVRSMGQIRCRERSGTNTPRRRNAAGAWAMDTARNPGTSLTNQKRSKKHPASIDQPGRPMPCAAARCSASAPR